MKTPVLFLACLGWLLAVSTVHAGFGNPATVNFSPLTVNLGNGGNPAGGISALRTVSVTLSGGVGPTGYWCTVPDGFQMTNASQFALPALSDPADIEVSCTLGVVPRTAQSICTLSAAPDVVLTLNCPASTTIFDGITPTPANGTPLTCDGDPFSTRETGVTLTNTSTQPYLGLSCSTTGNGFSIRQPPAGTLAVNATTAIVVSCIVPAHGAPAARGELFCTAQNGGGAFAFPLSSLGQTFGVPGRLAEIPTLSAWALFVLCAAFVLAGIALVPQGPIERRRVALQHSSRSRC